MATFRGSGSKINGAAFPTEAELQNAIDEAEASATAAAASHAAAEVNVTESETAETAAQAAQALAEQAVTDAEAQVVLAQDEVALAEAQVALAVAQVALADTARTGAETAETNAETAETNAETAETNAATSASNAATSEAGASAFATTALGHANNAATSYDDFDDRYLGAKASAPTVDNDGNALVEGALYWNSTGNSTKIYNGSAWVALADAITETEANALYQPLDDELSDIALLAPTKGRLIAGNGTAWVDLGVGTNDQVVTADSAETVGMKWGAIPVQVEHFVSAGETSWAAGGTYEYSHGFAGTPVNIACHLVCTTAEYQYAIGDVVDVGAATYRYINTAYGAQVYSNATVVGVAVGGSSFIYYGRTDNTGHVPTPANWTLYVTGTYYP